MSSLSGYIPAIPVISVMLSTTKTGLFLPLIAHVQCKFAVVDIHITYAMYPAQVVKYGPGMLALYYSLFVGLVHFFVEI